MNESFPRIITLLRKEKKVSQKQAAADLKISQALLSHYEKGIRECGLDFLVRTADYYGVSCDYLLGRTPDRTGAVLTVEDLPDADAHNTDKVYKGGVVAVLNKKLIANSLNIIFDLLQRCGSKALINELSAFLTFAVYLSFRVLYDAGEKNPQGMFEVPCSLYAGFANASMLIAHANAASAAKESKTTAEALCMTPETLKERYPFFCQSLFNLIGRAEAQLAGRQK